MTSYVALLRAVNLAGRNKVGMADLRAAAESLGYAEPRTLLQSGNLLLRGPARPDPVLERNLRDAARKKLGMEIDFFVRSAAEWQALVAENPFPREAKSDPGHLVAIALTGAPGRAELKALEQAIQGRERIRLSGRTAYAFYPDGIGRSKLTMALIEKKLGVRGTGRNWNTVLKLAALLNE
ncbi:MAG TPA: DUF1697 domain-containing protein [Candidatus Binatia bacterium]|nr:DUF1697 domain-containing protein [Candidatus Binatia bacterium]